MDHVFVAREQELERLQRFLDRSLGGQGQICFVTGEAGFGKTSLTTEFARRAQIQHEEILIAVGNCNAQVGIGDPYLPFREILGMLTGDVDDKLAQGAITEENAGRLRRFLRTSRDVLVDVGPNLIDIFVPGAGIVTRAGALVAGDSAWMKRMDPLRERGGGHDDERKSASSQALGAEQGRIFEQVTAVLGALAKQRMLVLILDDLQWIDESSASLLFHVARRIGSSRIMILGTYRPEDVAQGRGSQRHPLVQVVSELKRESGDVLIAIDEQPAAQATQFINAFLDSEANQLDAAFRHSLVQHTRGHPLFISELLRGMEERGDLGRDAHGRWVQRTAIDWSAMPARIEGVIEERINRLRKDLQELLCIASVEGETFTAQIVARIQAINERQMITTLSQELEKQHRLVREEGVERIGASRLSTFRFRHNLLQKYLYRSLGESEREMLHEDFAGIIESLYEGRTDEVAVQLARHYQHARQHDKAAAYLLQAGRRAMAVYAYREAITLATQGLALLGSLPDAVRHKELQLDLRLLLGDALGKAGKITESMESFRQTAEIAATLAMPDAMAMAALGYDFPRWRLNLPATTAIDLLGRALKGMGHRDSVLRVRLLAEMARASVDTVPDEEISAMLDAAVAMARRLGDPQALVEALFMRVVQDRAPENIPQRIATIEEMRGLARQLDDKRLLIDLHELHIIEQVALGNVDAWERDLAEHIRLAEEIQEPFRNFISETMNAARAILVGRFDDADGLAQKAFELGQQLGIDNAEGVLGIQMFTIRREQGRLRELAPVVRYFVNEPGGAAAWRPGLALIYADLGYLDEARVEFERLAEGDFATIARDSLWQTCLSYLAEVCVGLGDVVRAEILYNLLLPYAELTIVVGNAIACLGATSRFLGQLATLLARWDEAEGHFRQGLELNSRMDAKPWLAHTRYDYASMLVARGRPGDRDRAIGMVGEALAVAQQLGMNRLVQRIRARTGDG